MTPLVYQCCVCGRYRDIEGQYRVYLFVCPFFRVSHGFCLDCMTLIREERRDPFIREGSGVVNKDSRG
jgi:hypothetical protein